MRSHERAASALAFDLTRLTGKTRVSFSFTAPATILSMIGFGRNEAWGRKQ